ncbi:hypothetical protein PR048_017750 [Dryococelus australis]|uniref:Uncharacterized protein n=1 Tax=Dryococelus australis TaxID=614101 RepID=A0ABQ9HAG4_9NEOP|nr:hypothetical protein PR048_017750 [Dryococelus australis]
MEPASFRHCGLSRLRRTAPTQAYWQRRTLYLGYHVHMISPRLAFTVQPALNRVCVRHLLALRDVGIGKELGLEQKVISYGEFGVGKIPAARCAVFQKGSNPGGAAPGYSHVGIVSDAAAGQWVFSGISGFPAIDSGAHCSLLTSLHPHRGVEKARLASCLPAAQDRNTSRLGNSPGLVGGQEIMQRRVLPLKKIGNGTTAIGFHFALKFSPCPASPQCSRLLRAPSRTVGFTRRVSRPLVHSRHEHLARRHHAIFCRRLHTTSLAHSARWPLPKIADRGEKGLWRQLVWPLSINHGLPRKGGGEATSASFGKRGGSRWVTPYSAGQPTRRQLHRMARSRMVSSHRHLYRRCEQILRFNRILCGTSGHRSAVGGKGGTAASEFLSPFSHSTRRFTQQWYFYDDAARRTHEGSATHRCCGYADRWLGDLTDPNYYPALYTVGHRSKSECCEIRPELVFPLLTSPLRSSLRLGSAVMQGRGKWEVPEKTRQPAASSGTISTCENPGPAANRTRFA